MRKKLLVIIAILQLPALMACAQNYALSLNGTSGYVTIGMPLSSNGSYTKEAYPTGQVHLAGFQKLM
jgi:hypothetical protein